MRINHNIPAMNANRQLAFNNTSVSKSLEKLSSGLRINRAGDDAAGLAISEKMRGQIRGLDQAIRNAQDGISLIQTAEGALSETHSILQRMRELAVQSSNGTYDDKIDRSALNAEVEALKTEIDRISTSTNFNGKVLLDGSLSELGQLKVGGKTIGVATVVGGINPITGTDFTLNAATTGSIANGVSPLITGEKTAALNDVKFTFKLGSFDADPTVAVDSEKGEIIITLSADQTKNSADTLKTAFSAALEASALLYKDSSGNFYYKATGDAYTTDGTTFADFNKITSNADDIINQSMIDELNSSITKGFGNVAVTGQEGAAQVFQVGDKVGNTLEVKFTQMQDADANDINTFLNGYTFRVTAGDKSYIQTNVDETKKVITIGLSTVQSLNTDANIETALTGLKVNGYVLDGTNVAFSVTGAGDLLDGTGSGLDLSKFVPKGGATDGLSFQIGANGVEDQRVKVYVADMSTSGLGISSISVGTQEAATSAINVIETSINAVSSQRATLGALQNRFEHTINNLGVAYENLTAAESRIRDVDMAKEMMEFTKNNILVQSAQAMLAQANQSPQGVLQLLR